MTHSGNLHPPSENTETRRPEGPSLIPKFQKIVAGPPTYRKAPDAPPVLHLRVGLELDIVSHSRAE